MPIGAAWIRHSPCDEIGVTSGVAPDASQDVPLFTVSLHTSEALLEKGGRLANQKAPKRRCPRVSPIRGMKAMQKTAWYNDRRGRSS